MFKRLSGRSKIVLKLIAIGILILVFYRVSLSLAYRGVVLYERSLSKSLNEEWLSRTSLLAPEDIPQVDWVEDSLTSKGFNSFLYLDKNCEEVRKLNHALWPINSSNYYWWKARLGKEYCITKEQVTAPAYQVTQSDTSLYILTSKEPDTWIYLPSVDPQPEIYALDFDYYPKGDQYETLQIDVRLQSLANRLKFVIRNNEFVKFDMYIRATDLSALREERWKKYFKPISLAKDSFSHIRIEVIGDIYSFIVNQDRVLSVKVNNTTHIGDYWCLMLWNGVENNTVPCEMEIKNFKIFHKR